MFIIILLSNTKSSIQILTKQFFTYNAQGTVISFPYCLYHESHYTDENTTKFNFFLKDSKNIMTSGNGNRRVTRNAKVRKE